MEVPAAPVMEPDTDLEDAVVQPADGPGRGAPQKLERLVLLEELTRVELLDATKKLGRWRILASRAGGLVGCAVRLPLRTAGGLARAATSALVAIRRPQARSR